jgi:dienelactone hydrolase
MKFKFIMPVVLIAAFTTLNLHAQDIDYKGFPEWSWHKKGSTEYYLYTPKNMVPGKKYPLTLFLHGCCGIDDHATLKNLVDAPARMWHNYGANTQRIPTYIVVPATSRGWAQHIPDIKKVIDSLVAECNANAKRLYICGFSMGAQGTFTFINQYPDYFAAAITMGMKFSGDSVKVKNIPMWVNQGETDYFSRALRKQVKAFRALNGNPADTGSTWNTGVNPRYSNFKGKGHVILWEAPTQQDMLSWAYAKVNDGNKYPNVFFNSPNYAGTVELKPLKLDISAADPDGSIAKIDIYLNHALVKTLKAAPYVTTVTPKQGRNFIEAVATDNQGKARSAVLVVNTPSPLKIITTTLPIAAAGKYYKVKMVAAGYGATRFSAKALLPAGLQLFSDGTLCGVPVTKGVFPVTIMVGDSIHTLSKTYTLTIKPKAAEEVLVTNAKNVNGIPYHVSKLMKGETPNFNSKDTEPNTLLQEINFSGLDKYADLSYIKTDVNDTARTDKELLSFNVDENVTVYVAYEVHDMKYHSSVPQWLNDFEKQPGQIVAQYRYFNVYAKKYPKGKITLPGGDTKRNGVSTNYFVIVKKQP